MESMIPRGVFREAISTSCRLSLVAVRGTISNEKFPQRYNSLRAVMSSETTPLKDFIIRFLYPRPFDPIGVELELPEPATVCATLLSNDARVLLQLLDNVTLPAGTHVLDIPHQPPERHPLYVEIEFRTERGVSRMTRAVR